MSNRGNLLVLSAPSGSGKTSLANRLIRQLEGVRFSVSHTTRPRRSGEQNGVEYFFVTTDEFERMIQANQFLEYAHVYGNYYGTSRQYVETELSEGRDVLLDIDIQGALRVKELYPDAVMIFVLPPSFEVLRQRLKGRGLDEQEVIDLRLAIAKTEIRYYRDYDYLIINTDLEESEVELKAIVRSARCLVRRRIQEAETIVKTFFE